MEKYEDDSSELFKEKRSQFSVEIRKKKKEEMINFKRVKLLEEKKLDGLKDFKIDDTHLQNIANDFLNSLSQKNVQATISATVEIKNSLSHPQAPREKIVLFFIDKEIVKYLVDFLKENYRVYPELQNEAAWALCNITAINSQACEYCLKSNILSNLLKAFDFAEGDFFDNCLWTLANIAGDNFVGVREQLLAIGLVDYLAKLIRENSDRVLRTRTSIWLISNLARGKPYPPAKHIFGQLLLSEDIETVEFCLWTISYLTETDQETNLQFFTGNDITSKVIKLLKDRRSPDFLRLSLRYLGNISLGEENDELIEGGFLNYAVENLRQLDTKAKATTTVLWILSNICAESIEFIEEILATELPKILIKIASEEEECLRTEGMYCLRNMLMIASKEQIQELVSKNIVKSISVNLDSHHNSSLIEMTLNCLYKLLVAGDSMTGGNHELNPYARLIWDTASESLFRLQNHKNEKICKMINCLMDEYFDPLSHQNDNLMKE